MPAQCSSIVGVTTASALQINKQGTQSTSDDWCYITGQYTEDKTFLDLISRDDPTAGLKLTYLGTKCSNGKNREFNIILTCADKLNPSPLHAVETSPCVYTVTMPSVYGCPLECPVSKRSLCGGAGFCGYDYDNQKARCYCNKGS